MQTVCEGLHVNSKIANVDDFDNLAILCLVMTLCWTLPWDLFPLGCKCFLKLILPITNTSKCIKKHVYIIYINISIYCISFFVKAELQMYGCNASWVIEQDVREHNDLYPQRYDCRKWNKTSLSMHCAFCHGALASHVCWNHL